MAFSAFSSRKVHKLGFDWRLMLNLMKKVMLDTTAKSADFDDDEGGLVHKLGFLLEILLIFKFVSFTAGSRQTNRGQQMGLSLYPPINVDVAKFKDGGA